MDTKPLKWHDPDPANSCDKGVTESETLGHTGAAIRYSPPVQDKKAPRAEPEDDIDMDMHMQEPGATQCTETANVTKTENQDSIGIRLCTSSGTKNMTELEQISNKLSQVLEEYKESQYDDFFPPPPPLGVLSPEECSEKGFSIDVDVAEWISDTDIITDPTVDLASSDSQCGQKWQTGQFTEPINVAVDSEEMIEDGEMAEETVVPLSSLPDGFTDSKPESNLSADGTNSTAHQFPPDRNDFNDLHFVSSPPYADESEEEEEEEVKVTLCQLQSGAVDISSGSFHSAEDDFAVTVSALHIDNQQEELSPQSLCKPAPKGVNQEVAQQVLSRGSPPLSTVAMELSNQDGLATQGSGCAVAVVEKNSRAGQRTEGESQQTGGEEGQTESGLTTDKAAAQKPTRGLLKPSKSVHIQDSKEEKPKCVSFKCSRMESDSCDDSQSDSGVSADYSPCSTLESSTNIPTGSPATVLKETPIEREIRRAVEREHSLRRSRGLPNRPTSPEYVEIPLRKAVLFQSSTDKNERCQGKDREYAGKKMQHEIHEEVQREEDLVKLGKVPGFYDKGTVRQLKERKQLFESFQKPNESTLAFLPRCKATSWSSTSDQPTLEVQDGLSSQASHGQRSKELLSPSQNPNSDNRSASTYPPAREPGFSEGPNCQVIILENNQYYQNKPEAITAPDPSPPFVSEGCCSGIAVMVHEDEEKEKDLVPKENPFFKLRTSTALVKVEQDIREAQERERELRKQRINLYGAIGGIKGDRGGGGGAVSMEAQSNTLSTSSLNGLAVPDLPHPSQNEGTKPPPAHQSAGKLGVWPPAPAGEEKISQPEVPHSPRTPRQKTPLVQRWESGLINGHNSEEN